MANNGRQEKSRHPTRAKRKVVTSCQECYRRKQKCDRMKPCSFCSTRGVPELCRYGTVSHIPIAEKVQLLSPSASSKDSQDEIEPTSPLEFLDQIGYSPASRRNAFEAVGEHYSEFAPNDTSAINTVTIPSTSIFKSLVARLPSNHLTDALMDAHFSMENWSFPVLEEHHFRNLHKQFRGCLDESLSADKALHLTTTLAALPALIFSVLAVALQFVTPDSELARILTLTTTSQCVRLSQQYLDFGQEIIKLFERQRPTMTSIEFYLVKVSWLKNCGRGSEAWQCLGVALRQAQQIDLHQIEEVSENASLSVEDTLIQVWEIEYRKRLWAKIFIMDSHMAVGLGRPRGIHREDCTTLMPIDCEFPREPSETVPVSTNHGRQPPNNFSSVMFWITLSHKYHDLMTMRASKADLRDYSRVTSLHNGVESMLTELPPALRPSFSDTSWDYQNTQLPVVRQRLLTTANIFLLALHRPYISTHVASRDAAMKAAFTILEAQQSLFEMVPQAQHKMYGYSFYTVDAGMFLTGIILKYSASSIDIVSRALHELQQACARLSGMKERSVIAGTGEVVMRKCCDLIKSTMPSPFSFGSSDYLTDTPSTMDLGSTDILQELNCGSPDQMTRQLIELLGNPAIAGGSFPEHSTPLADDMFTGDILTLTNSTSSNWFTDSDFTTSDIWKQRFP